MRGERCAVFNTNQTALIGGEHHLVRGIAADLVFTSPPEVSVPWAAVYVYPGQRFPFGTQALSFSDPAHLPS